MKEAQESSFSIDDFNFQLISILRDAFNSYDFDIAISEGIIDEDYEIFFFKLNHLGLQTDLANDRLKYATSEKCRESIMANIMSKDFDLIRKDLYINDLKKEMENLSIQANSKNISRIFAKSLIRIKQIYFGLEMCLDGVLLWYEKYRIEVKNNPNYQLDNIAERSNSLATFAEIEINKTTETLGILVEIGIIDLIKKQLEEPENSVHMTDVLVSLKIVSNVKDEKEKVARYIRQLREGNFWNEGLRKRVKKHLTKLNLK